MKRDVASLPNLVDPGDRPTGLAKSFCMRIANRFLAVSLLAVVTSCGGARPATPARVDDAPIRAPRILVTADAVVAFGRPLEDVRELTRFHRLDRLYTILRDTRATLRAESGSELPRSMILEATADASPVAFLSAATTCAFAGQWDLWMRAPDGTWAEATYAVPGRNTHEPPREWTRLSARLEPARITLTWKTNRGCDRLPADASIAPEELPRILGASCPRDATCYDDVVVFVVGDVTVDAIVHALAALRKRGTDATMFFVVPTNEPPASRRECGDTSPERAL